MCVSTQSARSWRFAAREYSGEYSTRREIRRRHLAQHRHRESHVIGRVHARKQQRHGPDLGSASVRSRAARHGLRAVPPGVLRILFVTRSHPADPPFDGPFVEPGSPTRSGRLDARTRDFLRDERLARHWRPCDGTIFKPRCLTCRKGLKNVRQLINYRPLFSLTEA